MCKCGSFADKDEETYYSELMDEIDKTYTYRSFHRNLYTKSFYYKIICLPGIMLQHHMCIIMCIGSGIV